MSRFHRRRWGDNDRYFGPFTFARDDRYRHTGIVLSSADDDERPANLRISGFGFTLIVAMPAWALRPERTFKRWTGEPPKWATGDGYWNITPREIGFTMSEGHLSVRYGRQTMDSSTEQSWGYFWPWREWRHVRRSLYRPSGRLFADMLDSDRPKSRGFDRFREEEAIVERCPTISYAFLDYDGQPITATCRIEEREWRWGTRRLPWRLLSLFRRPRIERSLDLRFSAEVGKRKGSWKGGTLGHGISMERLKGGYESTESAFQRYCDENGLTFVREPHLFERYGLTEKPADWNREVLGWFHRGPEARDKDADGFAAAWRDRAQTGTGVTDEPKA